MKLGIAGVPENVADVTALCHRMRVTPVFVLGPEDGAPPRDLPAPPIRVPAWGVGPCAAQLRGAGLGGLWTGLPPLYAAVAAIAAHLRYPHIPCAEAGPITPPAIAGAQLLDLAALESLREGGDTLPVPAWVRSTCGDADASCMRVEHPSDFSLAMQKLRKRNPGGQLRIQPAVEGDIYRLLAFKTGRTLTPVDIVEESVTPSVYRVPLGMAMPMPRRGALHEAIGRVAAAVNRDLPPGHGYVEMEFVASPGGVALTDVQAPAHLSRELRDLVRLSLGVDLLRASLECALGRAPSISPTTETGVAFTWLLTRSGVVTGLEGVEAARAMPGVMEVEIRAKEGDILSHVVDRASRERGGYIIARGATAAIAKARLEAAREALRINTSPALT